MSNWSPTIARAKLAQLMHPGVLGFYTQFEVTEVLAFIPGQKIPINIFSLLVAEDHSGKASQLPQFLNPLRIKLKSLKHWSFGVAQYTVPVVKLSPLLEQLTEKSEWSPSGHPLQIAKLTSIPIQFVPPDSTIEVPLNRLLKNNFWNGSHVLEWIDSKKSFLRLLYDDPRRLQELSQEVQKYVPLALASLSDRLGNIVIQLPVNVLISKFKILNGSNDILIEIVWHPKASPRALRATYEMEFDGIISGYVSSMVQAPQTILPIQYEQKRLKGIIWDEQQQIILAATSPTSFIDTISTKLQTLDPEPRVFIKGKGMPESRVSLINKPIEWSVGERNNTDRWTQRRIYNNEKSRLATERYFVQYKPRYDQKESEHSKALKDIRYLIHKYGQVGTWLWDPYLGAYDIVETLFYCPYPYADLRALTAAIDPSKKSTNKMTFIRQQYKALEAVKSNLRGLRLEYRVRSGSSGWDFHDRFLIFPQAEHGALVWSLGTSVNSLGHKHHILQKIDDGQLVMDAFVDLWDQLAESKYLIWKKS